MAALAVTQLIGWGTTFYLPAILAEPMSLAAGIPAAWTYGGVSLMLLVSAILAPMAGRILQRRGARGAMVAGSLGFTVGLTALAFADSPATFLTAWLIIGAATPFALVQAASVAVVQAAPERGARRALTILLLSTSLASTACWPVLIWLDAAVGLRTSLFVYAAVHLLVCAPLHALAIMGGPRASSRGSLAPKADAVSPPRSAGPVRGAFWLCAVAFSCAGIISWGLPLHAVSLLEEAGHARSAAVAIGAVLGPAQLLARVLELVGGHRLDILTVGVAAAAILPAALLVFGVAGATIGGAVLFTIGYGLSVGTMSIVRAVAPLRLFGQTGYALVLGRMLAPMNFAFAAAPLLFAAARQAGGATTLIGLALALSFGSLAALLVLRFRASAESPP